MAHRFDTPPTERPDPGHYLRKREGSPGGMKRPPGSPERSGGSGSAGLIPARPASGSRSSPSSGASRGPSSPFSPNPGTTLFCRMYERGDLPCKVDQSRAAGHNTIKWTADLAAIDLHYYLPVFVEGLMETQEPFRMLARRGVDELVTGCGGDRVLPVIPQLVMGLRAALNARSDDIISAALHVVDLLAQSSEAAGAALVPYYRQLLPPLNRHVNDNLNIGDAIDYGQAKHKGSLGDLVLGTLRLLESVGGPDAFLNIKYYVPTYESGLRPSRLARRQ